MLTDLIRYLRQRRAGRVPVYVTPAERIRLARLVDDHAHGRLHRVA
jgi:hypothetical protein